MNENPSNPAPRIRQGMDYGEHAEVHEVHAAIQREKREPRVGLEPLSIWLIAVYTSKKIGPQGPGGGAAEQLSPAERGKKVFAANCQVCHQADGNGSAGQGYPPLAGSEFTNGGSRRAAMIVLKGLQGPVTVKGKQYGSAVMQPWESLGDQKVADVLTYERSAWGNKGSPVTKEQIAAFRKELASHPGSYTAPDVEAAPDDDLPGGAPAEGAAAGQPPKPAANAASPPPKG
jgi:mono/diheme cytochrome c family protein